MHIKPDICPGLQNFYVDSIPFLLITPLLFTRGDLQWSTLHLDTWLKVKFLLTPKRITDALCYHVFMCTVFDSKLILSKTENRNVIDQNIVQKTVLVILHLKRVLLQEKKTRIMPFAYPGRMFSFCFSHSKSKKKKSIVSWTRSKTCLYLQISLNKDLKDYLL